MTSNPRDEFASVAMQALIGQSYLTMASEADESNREMALARKAYAIADAMLAVRAETEKADHLAFDQR